MYGCGIDHEDAIWVSNYSYGDLQHIFWGFENLHFMQFDFFGRNNDTTPPCWSKTRNGVKFGLTALSKIVQVCQLDFCSYTHISMRKRWTTFWLVV